MGKILRKLCAYLCVPIYNLIPKIYKIFYSLASDKFFKDDTVEQFSQNLYVLISVVMLFGFSITILSAIVNPDLLSDKKKGVTALFKRAIIGLALIVLIPFGFNKMYEIQENIVTNSLIEKIIVGADFSCKDNDENCEPGKGGGQVIAGMLINSVLHPTEDNVGAGAKLEDIYVNMVQNDIGKISTMASYINTTRTDGKQNPNDEDENYVFHFDGLIALIAGLGVCYILILFALDMAVRIFKLALLELTAPISIVGYIAAGDKILSSWFKEVGKTYVDVFVRLAAIAFYLFLISRLPGFISYYDESFSFILNTFLIVGMLIFVKQIPDLISKIFGIEIKSQGGIGGRLGQMAMVGDIAKKAWGGVKNVAGIGAATVGLGLATVSNPLLAAGVGTLAGVGFHAWNKGIGGKAPLKDGTVGRAVRTAGAFLRGKNGVADTIDAYKKWTDDDSYKNEQYQQDQARITKIKDESKASAQKTANTITGRNIYDNRGNLDMNEAKLTDFGTIMDSGDTPFNAFETGVIKEYDKKRDAKRHAEYSQDSYDSISKLISNAISASSSSVDKSKLLALQSDFESGGVNIRRLASYLVNQRIDSLTDATTGGLNSTALNIIKNASNLNDGGGLTQSLQTLQDNIDEANTKFSGAEKAYNDMVDKMGEKKKYAAKAYAKVGDDISKSKLH